MKRILVKKLPFNKKHFLRLREFYKELIKELKLFNINPILYGSLAFFGHTKSMDFLVNDIDFLIREKDFKPLIKMLKRKKIKYSYYPKWHTLQVFKKKLKIEFDSIDFWQKDLPNDFIILDFNGLALKSVSCRTLMKIYKRASEVSKDNPRGNRRKYEFLRKFNKNH